MPESYEDNDSRRNKVVVVTGSGKGVGKIIATEFAKSGYYVMINDLEQVDELKLAAEEISKEIGDDNNNKVAYVVGEVGIKSLPKTVALQLAENGIRVNAIALGIIATDKIGNKEKRREQEKNIPFHRMGCPEEIAKIALFLASDDASYITGSLIYAGLTTFPPTSITLKSLNSTS
jgi:NAD(P)-dependent dehydrogenase (short-subunit alcohol dehydrogenase family)